MESSEQLFLICKKSAKQGNAFAQCGLGVMYAQGEGVQQDYAKAVKWYRKSAEQGCAEAIYILGLMYYQGEGVQQDYAEAAKWFRRSADQGNAEAQYNLGEIYDQGKGVLKSHATATALYYKAGCSFLREGKLDDANRCRGQIGRLSAPDAAFCAENLLTLIYLYLRELRRLRLKTETPPICELQMKLSEGVEPIEKVGSHYLEGME
jgi:TPR repeat protein